MCGIVGIHNFDGAPIDPNVLENMAQLIAYRGPDDEGFWFAKGVGLGHRRLSIIDLSSAGHQPLSNEDASIWIVFNGEIYNYKELRGTLEGKGHRFRSNTDTEVIIHSYEEWGHDCLQRFNGMFAFAIWNDKEQELWLVRDRLGVKPLYYFIDSGKIVFASEIKAIFQVPGITRRPDSQAVLDYLMYQFTFGDETFFTGIRKLLPGHYMLLKGGSCRLVRYWAPPRDTIDLDGKRGVKELQERVKNLLIDSIRLRLRSDVEVGCYLSGGIDSSSITCLASKLSVQRIKSFTGKFSESPEFDETNYARIVSDFAATDYHELNVEFGAVKDMLAKIIWYMDEPTAGPGVVPQYFISELASRFVKVVLGGQGGDELFGGYGWYRKALFAILLRKWRFSHEVFKSGSALSFLMDYGKREGIARILEGCLRFGLRDEAATVYRKARSIFGPREIGGIIRGGILDSGVMDSEDRFLEAFTEIEGEDIVSRFFKFDVQYYLPALLHVEDRTSMAVSLESRLPLLDYRFVELACQIPSEWKIGMGNSKYLLRESLKDILPPEIYLRRDKKGFPTPIEFWFRGNNGELIATCRDFGKGGGGEILNKSAVEKIHKAVQAGERKAAEKLWRCLSVVMWYDQFIKQYPRISQEQLARRPSLGRKQPMA